MTYSIISERKEERYIDMEVGWIDNNTPNIETQYQFTTWTLVEFDFGDMKKIIDVPHFMTSDDIQIDLNLQNRYISEKKILKNGG
jgi:hypothetical protein